MENYIIPVTPPLMEKTQHDYPISPRENLLRAFRHEKPLYMPCLYQATQFIVPAAYARNTQSGNKDSTDWFGTQYRYEALQQGTTPVPPYVMEEIGQWRERIRWPDLQRMDWAELPGYRREEELAAACRCLGNGTFEELHFLEGFEQCLVDMLTEPEECRAFFERLTDFKIELFQRQNQVYHFDYACHNDDWSNARAPFFSTDIFEKTLLEPAIRLAEAVRAAGCRYMFHTCGKMEAWLPYIVHDIKADLIEIQNINDTAYILETYGDKLTVEYCPDMNIMYNPATTEEEARAYARSLVDRFGARNNKGSGIAVRLIGNCPISYYAFEDELYHYSLRQYAGLS